MQVNIVPFPYGTVAAPELNHAIVAFVVMIDRRPMPSYPGDEIRPVIITHTERGFTVTPPRYPNADQYRYFMAYRDALSAAQQVACACAGEIIARCHDAALREMPEAIASTAIPPNHQA